MTKNPKTTHAYHKQLAREAIVRELKKAYPSSNDLKKKLIEMQGGSEPVLYETAYNLAKELFKDWYFDDIRDFCVQCGYTSIYEYGHKRACVEHYKRVARVILLNIHY